MIIPTMKSPPMLETRGTQPTGWQPIETHPLDEKECLLAEFVDGDVYIADRGGWVPGETHEEWDEVVDGIAVMLFKEEDEGHWWTNHEVMNEPSHWRPLKTNKEPTT